MKKALLNQLRIERFDRLDIVEKGLLVKKIRKKYGYTYRELQKLTGIPHSTLVDWVTGRQDNKGKNIHISFIMVYRKLKNMQPSDVDDWGRIELIKEEIERLLNGKK